jgi:hypothetical protein
MFTFDMTHTDAWTATPVRKRFVACTSPKSAGLQAVLPDLDWAVDSGGRPAVAYDELSPVLHAAVRAKGLDTANSFWTRRVSLEAVGWALDALDSVDPFDMGAAWPGDTFRAEVKRRALAWSGSSEVSTEARKTPFVDDGLLITTHFLGPAENFAQGESPPPAWMLKIAFAPQVLLGEGGSLDVLGTLDFVLGPRFNRAQFVDEHSSLRLALQVLGALWIQRSKPTQQEVNIPAVVASGVCGLLRDAAFPAQLVVHQPVLELRTADLRLGVAWDERRSSGARAQAAFEQAHISRAVHPRSVPQLSRLLSTSLPASTVAELVGKLALAASLVRASDMPPAGLDLLSAVEAWLAHGQVGHLDALLAAHGPGSTDPKEPAGLVEALVAGVRTRAAHERDAARPGAGAAAVVAAIPPDTAAGLGARSQRNTLSAADQLALSSSMTADFAAMVRRVVAAFSGSNTDGDRLDALAVMLGGASATSPSRRPHATLAQVGWGHVASAVVPGLPACDDLADSLSRLLGRAVVRAVSPSGAVSFVAMPLLAAQASARFWAPDLTAAAGSARRSALIDLYSPFVHARRIADGTADRAAAEAAAVPADELYTSLAHLTSAVDVAAAVLSVLGARDDFEHSAVAHNASAHSWRTVVGDVRAVWVEFGPSTEQGQGVAHVGEDLRPALGRSTRQYILGLLAEFAQRLNRFRYVSDPSVQLDPRFRSPSSPAHADWRTFVGLLHARAEQRRINRVEALGTPLASAASSAAALTQADLERMLASSPSFARLLKRKAPPGGPGASGEEEETAVKTPSTAPKLKASLPLGKWVDGGSNYLLDGVRYSRAEAVTQLEDLSLEPGDYCLEVLYSAGRVSDRVDHSQCPDGHESSSARHRIPKGFKPSLCRTDREERTARGAGGKDKRGSPTGKKGKGKGK